MSSSNVQSSPNVCVIAGDDAAPEVMRPTVEILRKHSLVRRGKG